MIRHKKHTTFLLISMCSSFLFLTSCGQNNTSHSIDSPNRDETSTLAEETQPLASDVDKSDSSAKGSRDNTPECLIPSADGLITYGNDSVTIDASHTDSGYIMVQYSGTVQKVKLQITGPNSITYTYNLSSSYEAFPLASDNGNYKLAVYENIQADQYSTLFENTIAVDIQNEFLPYLYANQYVNFTESSDCIGLAEDLAASANNDLDVIASTYNYIIDNITYDYDKATTVQSGYIPDVDNVLSTKTGICFDYASLMASMLRSQKIPTRLEIGYVGEAYHAWISTYIKDVGWVNGIIEFDGDKWTLMDPTFAANSSEASLKDFIGNGSNYMTKYIY